MSAEPKRAIVLRHADADRRDIERLTQQHRLNVVYTAVTDTAVPRLAVMIAVEHALDHRAEVVVVPHLTAEDAWADREWRALAELFEVVGADGVMSDSDAGVARP
ncbi:hypothetical protein ACWCPQ_16940 [Nocardia sp. NPDC001965]